MYATKPLSLFRRQPEAASAPPPKGQNSGYLVVKSAADEEEDNQASCWGYSTRVWELPFPQNRVVKVQFGEDEEAVLFVPVLDQPLASNRYYAVVASGTRKGLVWACSREEDVATGCFCRCINDVEPRPFDPADVYQQMEIVQHGRGRFTAMAVAADGIPWALYRSKYWDVHTVKHKSFDLGEALGLDATLRSRLSPATVGRWYCPFFLVKEDGLVPRKQMASGAFYEVVLEQRWELVPEHGGLDVSKLARKKALIGGSVEGKQDPQTPRHGDAYVWFKAAATGQRVGVCTSLWERMHWEEHRGGWVDEEEELAAGSSVLVERFLVKRMDRSVAVAFDFVHLDKLRANQV